MKIIIQKRLNFNMPNKLIDIAGDVFGRLTVLHRDTEIKKHHIWWKCVCECGINISIKGNRLKNGTTRSCGCLAKELSRKRLIKHGMHKTRTYKSWAMMRSRCINDKDVSFQYYGERGINVCDEWTSFEKFLLDMGERPRGTSIDRVDNDGSYCRENCKWSTPTEQALNKRKISGASSKYKGVSLINNATKNKWLCQIVVHSKNRHVGVFKTQEKAAQAYNDAVDKYKLNITRKNIIEVAL